MTEAIVRQQMPYDGNDHSVIFCDSDEAVLFSFKNPSSASDLDYDCQQRALCRRNRISYRSNRPIGAPALARACVLLKTVENHG
jgi:hypothetical protein